MLRISRSKFVQIQFLTVVFFALLVPAYGQSDVLLSDRAEFNNGEVVHVVEARANLEDVKIIDLYSSNVSVESTGFLGNNYSVRQKNLGDMEPGDKAKFNYSVDFSGYALLGADSFRYSGEKHRLSPKRVKGQKESGLSLLPMVTVFLVVAGLMALGVSRSRP